MVHIRGHLTEQEWAWLKERIEGEFWDYKIAQSIMKKISTNEVKPEPKIQQGVRPIVDDRRFTAEVNLENMTVMTYRDDKNGKLTYEDLQRMGCGHGSSKS